jgi:hypothetical protein
VIIGTKFDFLAERDIFRGLCPPHWVGGDNECVDFVRFGLPDPPAEINLFVPEESSQSSELACNRWVFGDDFNNEPEFDRGPLADPFTFGNDVMLPPLSSSLGLKINVCVSKCVSWVGGGMLIRTD